MKTNFHITASAPRQQLGAVLTIEYLFLAIIGVAAAVGASWLLFDYVMEQLPNLLNAMRLAFGYGLDQWFTDICDYINYDEPNVYGLDFDCNSPNTVMNALGSQMHLLAKHANFNGGNLLP